MSEQVNQLMRDTGADRNTAEMILKFTGGDIEGARKIFEAMPKEYLVLKIRYMGHKTHNYGAILFVANIKKKVIEEVEVVVSSKSEFSDIDTNLKFEEFKSKIKEIIKIGDINLVMIDRLREYINSEEIREAIFKNITADGVANLNDLRIIFAELLFKVLTEPNAAIKMDEEQLNAFRYLKNESFSLSDIGTSEEKKDERKYYGEESRKKEPEKKEGIEVRTISLVLLKIEPVLSPVKGIPITELRPGDEVIVRIIDDRDIGDYLAGLLGGKEGEERVPLSAVVKEVGKSDETDSIMLLVEFGPGIGGRCYVPPEIKVETPLSEELSDLKKMSGFSISPVLIVLILIILFVIFIIITIFSGGD